MNIRHTLLAVALSFSALLNAQTDSLTARLQAIKTRYNIVGMSVAVVKEGKQVYNKGFGSRDLTRNLPVTDSTVYRFASVSKMISATALMILYDQGYIDLDKDAGYYLGFSLRNPAFPNDTITVRHLLSHTSSLRDGTGYDNYLAVVYSNNPPAIKTLLQTSGQFYTANMFAAQRPNQKYFYYANINYGVIGAIVEAVSGQRFDRFVKDNIFAPLGMSASFNIADIPNINNVAVLYRNSAGWVPQTDNYQGTRPTALTLTGYTPGSCGVTFGPQGNMRVSTQDLTKFMIMHLNNGIYNDARILSDTTAQVMHRLNWTYNGSNGNNYYGIFNTYAAGNHTTTDLLPGETMIGHPGEAYGLISDLYYSPAKRFGIIFVTNGGVWGDGTYSGWYNIEEEVYQAVKATLAGFVTGVETKQPDKSELAVYPQPAAEELRIKLPEGTTTVSLHTLTGELKYTVTCTPQQNEITLTAKNYPAGVYFISALTGKGTVVKKVMISH